MLDLIFVKVESSSQLLSEIYGICLDTWNERAWHWATPVFMLRFYSFQVLTEAYGRPEWPVTFLPVLSNSLSELTGKANDWNKLTQAVIHIHSLARTHYTHADTVTLRYFQSFYLSLSHTHSVHFVRSNGNVSFQLFSSISFFGIALAASVIQYGHFDANIKDWDDSFTEMVSPVFPWSCAPHEVAAVSKRSNLFLFYLPPAHTTVRLHNTWQWQTRLASRGNDSRDAWLNLLCFVRGPLAADRCRASLYSSAVHWSPQCWNDNLKKRSQVATKKMRKNLA